MIKLNQEQLVNRLAEEARKFRKSNLRKHTIVINGVYFILRMDLDEKNIIVLSDSVVSFLLAETSRMEYRSFFKNLLKGIFVVCEEFNCNF